MYVVYVNTPNNKALVHSDRCANYIKRVADRTAAGYWSSPFATREAALAYGKSLGKKRVANAMGCCPRL